MVCSPRMKRLLSAAFAVMLVCGSGVGDTNSAWARKRPQEAQISVLNILGVRLNPDGSGLTLDANRPFTSNETRDFSVLKLPSPYRIVLDIPNARLTGGQKVFPVNRGGIDRVELMDRQSPFYSSVRAIVYVEDNRTLARLSPEFEGKSLKLLGGTPIAMTPDQVASTNFVRRPMTPHAQPLPPVAKPSAEMTKSAPTPPVAMPIALKKQNEAPAQGPQTVLDGPVAADATIVEAIYFRDNKLFIKSAPGSELSVKNRFTLTAPNRLVLDLDNAVLRNRELMEPINTNVDDIRQIRVGQFDEKTVRLVIEGGDPERCETIYHGGEKNLLAVSPYSSTSITKLSANTRLGEVQSIDLKREGSNTVLRLTASTPIVHRFLKKDNKLVLDLLNEAAHPTNINFDPKLYPEIEKMRLEPLTAGQPNSKLAIQLAHPSANVVPTISEDGKVLELQISMDESLIANSAFPNLAGLVSKAPFPARIVVDAGHGGKDNGAMRSGVSEKDLNLNLALMVRDALQARGFKVYMTRSTDVFLPLPKITSITNQIHPDLFISIHHNASVNASANGIETYYYTPQSVAFARKVHAREINSVGARDGGVKKAMFYVIHHTSVPAILCEVGYVSNPSELTELQGFERKSKTARAIADGVVDYLRTRVSAKAK